MRAVPPSSADRARAHPPSPRRPRPPAAALAAALPLLLAGCSKMVVLNPSGDVAVQQGHMVVVATVLMLLIVVPVLVLILGFAWHYRASNTQATYRPDWYHSTGLELIIWSAPMLIVLALGAVTWIGTHKLDPYRRLDRLDAARPLAAGAKPLRVQAVALDWKWLFIYPDLGVATVNEMAAPVDQPIEVQITAESVMNTFYVPALAGQIYAMPSMETRLNAVINKAGDYEGMSAHYSGAGFSHMRFVFKGLDRDGFARWVAGVRGGRQVLNRAEYLRLSRPTIADPVQYFGTSEPHLFDLVLNRCVPKGTTCMNTMMAMDAHGGGERGAGGHAEREMAMPMAPLPPADARGQGVAPGDAVRPVPPAGTTPLSGGAEAGAAVDPAHEDAHQATPMPTANASSPATSRPPAPARAGH